MDILHSSHTLSPRSYNNHYRINWMKKTVDEKITDPVVCHLTFFFFLNKKNNKLMTYYLKLSCFSNVFIQLIPAG